MFNWISSLSKAGKIALASCVAVVIITPAIVLPIVLRPSHLRVQEGTFSFSEIRVNAPTINNRVINSINDLDVFALLQEELLGTSGDAIIDLINDMFFDFEMTFELDEDGPEITMPVGQILIPLVRFLLSDYMHDVDGSFFYEGVALTGEDRVEALLRVVLGEAFGTFAFAQSIFQLMLAIEPDGAMLFGMGMNTHVSWPALFQIWQRETPQCFGQFIGSVTRFANGPLAAWDQRNTTMCDDPSTHRNQFITMMNNTRINIERDSDEITNIAQIEAAFPQLDIETIPSTLNSIWNLPHLEYELLNKNPWFTYFVWDNPELTTGVANNTLSWHPAYRSYRAWLNGGAWSNVLATTVDARALFTEAQMANLTTVGNANFVLAPFTGNFSPTGIAGTGATRNSNVRAIASGEFGSSQFNFPAINPFAARFGFAPNQFGWHADVLMELSVGVDILNGLAIDLLNYGMFVDPEWAAANPGASLAQLLANQVPMFDALYWIFMDAFSGIFFPEELAPKQQLISLFDTILDAGVGSDLNILNLLPVLEIFGLDLAELGIDIDEILETVDMVIGLIDDMSFIFVQNRDVYIAWSAPENMLFNLINAAGITYTLDSDGYLNFFTGNESLLEFILGMADTLGIADIPFTIEEAEQFLNIAVHYDMEAGEITLSLNVNISEMIDLGDGNYFPIDFALSLAFVYARQV